MSGVVVGAAWAVAELMNTSTANAAIEPMDALKGKDYGKERTVYPDYVLTPSGLQFKDIKEGSGDLPEDGDTVVLDWAGYTIGYYGRPFEARNKPKGGDFYNDKDLLRVKLGKDKLIAGFDEAVRSMRTGAIRRVVVPTELGYVDSSFDTYGPKPSNFSGQRALDFVIKNRGMIDKTLLFDIEIVRIIKG